MNDSRIAEIRQRISEIVSESTDFESTELNRRAGENLNEEMGIDSLTLLEVLLSIDQEYDTDFSEEELLEIQSIDQAAAKVVERLESKKAEVPAG